MKQRREKPTYKRLQFDFADYAVNRLDQLVAETESSSRAEVIRDALKLYEHLLMRAKEGYDIQLCKDDGEKRSLDLFFHVPREVTACR